MPSPAPLTPRLAANIARELFQLPEAEIDRISRYFYNGCHQLKEEPHE